MYNVKYLEGIRVMVFNATFNNIALYSAGQFCWWGKPEKTSVKFLSHNVIYSTPCLSGDQIHNVSGDRH